MPEPYAGAPGPAGTRYGSPTGTYAGPGIGAVSATVVQSATVAGRPGPLSAIAYGRVEASAPTSARVTQLR